MCPSYYETGILYVPGKGIGCRYIIKPKEPAMTQPLSGKIALVTGSSRGIGAATAKKLASQGATVAVVYGKSKDEGQKVVDAITKAGGKAKLYSANANKPETLPELAKAVLADFGTIDILVNNAGVLGGGLIGEIDYAEYERIRQVNVDAVFALTNAVVPHMKSGARIINISSILGERSLMPGISVYNATKFAVNGFTRSWARDLAPKGILVNSVQPGSTATDMNPEDGEGSQAQLAGIPLGRFGRPEEIAGAVAFFAGPDATFITGETLSVDGGAIA